jgi:hypothetical protein
MRYNGIYTYDREGRVRALDLDEKTKNPLKTFKDLEEFRKVFNSENNRRVNIKFWENKELYKS